MVAPPATLRVSDVLTYVKRQFGDESGVQIQDADIVRWLNNAQRELVSRTHMLKATASSTVTSGQAQYSLPANIIEIEYITIAGLVLTKVNSSEIQSVLGTGVTGQGVGKYYWEYAGTLNIYPVPNNNTDTLIIYYAAMPTMVNVAADLLSVPDRYFETLCTFVLSKAYELDEDWTAHQAQRAIFEQDASALKEAENITNGAFTVITEVGYQ